MIMVGVPSVGPMKTNIDPRLQEDEIVARLAEYLIEVQVDPNELSRVVKINKNLESKLVK